MVREIVFYGEKVLDFYFEQDQKVQLKIDFVFDLVRNERYVPVKFFKKLDGSDDIFEIRVITSQKSIRILCFLDEGKLVVLTNAFIKKTQKTPKKEIDSAERIKQEYIKTKNNERS